MSNDDLQEKIRLSREAFEVAQRVSAQLNEHFAIKDLHVAATGQKVLLITGIVEHETVRKAVIEFLNKEMPEWQVSYELSIG